jgi:hypothetical protein
VIVRVEAVHTGRTLGVIQRPQIAPRDGRTLDDDSFRQLAVTIARGGVGDPHARDDWDDWSMAWSESTRLVVPPFAIIVGSSAASFELWDTEDGIPIEVADREVVWHGDDVDELDAELALVLETRPGGEVCVWFAALEHQNPEMSSAVPGDPGGDGRVGLKRSIEPVPLAADVSAYADDPAGLAHSESVAARVWFEVDGKRAPNAASILETPLGQRLAMYFDELYAETSIF